MGFWLASCDDHREALLRKVAREEPEMAYLGMADVEGDYVCDVPGCRKKAVWELYFTSKENLKELKKYGYRDYR
ncbi:MAG: hypothetical protein ACTSYG_08485 [Candidatus Heimdallarchaeota archaeon]